MGIAALAAEASGTKEAKAEAEKEQAKEELKQAAAKAKKEKGGKQKAKPPKKVEEAKEKEKEAAAEKKAAKAEVKKAAAAAQVEKGGKKQLTAAKVLKAKTLEKKAKELEDCPSAKPEAKLKLKMDFAVAKEEAEEAEKELEIKGKVEVGDKKKVEKAMTAKANVLKFEAVAAKKKARAQQQTVQDAVEFAEELKQDVVKARQTYAQKAWKANVAKVEAAKQEDPVLMNKKRNPLSRAKDLDETVEQDPDEEYSLNLQKDVEQADPEIDLTARFKPWPKSSEEQDKRLLRAKLKAERGKKERIKTMSTFQVAQQ